MRTIPAELAVRLASGVTTLAHVWRVARRDGGVFGFTDHDAPLAFDDLICTPTDGLTPGAIEKSLGLGVDSASVAGALSSDALSEGDLAAGVWDGARVDVYRVDWTDPALRVHLFSGRIGEVRRGVSAFEAELRGLQAPLNTPVGRVFSRFCDADLGDARCGKTITSATFSAAASVAEVVSSLAFRTSDLSAYGDAWFTRGRLVWSAGGESTIVAHRKQGADAIIELLEAPAGGVDIAAAFTVYAGCDKRLTSCAAKFDNVANFRGFPHMPGNDAVQAGPIAGEPHDGGSRWS